MNKQIKDWIEAWWEERLNGKRKRVYQIVFNIYYDGTIKASVSNDEGKTIYKKDQSEEMRGYIRFKIAQLQGEYE